MDNDIAILKIELACNPNSGIIKINKQKFHALLHSGAEVSLVHTWVYNSLKGKPNLMLMTQCQQYKFAVKIMTKSHCTRFSQ